MALSTEQALALLLILNSAHLTAADCPEPDRVAVSGSAGGRAVLPCSYTPTPGQDVAVTWTSKARFNYFKNNDHNTNN
ncbi:uncharacterized protein LOC131704975 isoform X2 [Acipenser ruthenus]|uniref:uncharacterized protein LOC131704975 isoform X2 n=1 Tax=Acipenser ruthenus TaxID=7906 RepID=UPI00274165A7|nr:uncharacterized protein LOC131704975 isoform X2 [Acipenser ruthenus]